MRVTITADDKLVRIDGVNINGINMTELDPSIHAIQWYGTYGEIEYIDRATATMIGNLAIDDLTPYNYLIERHAAAVQAQIDEATASALNPPVPQSVTKFQAKAVLLQEGLLARVEAYMADPATPAITKLAWTEAMTFDRASLTVAAMATLLGLSPPQVDSLFITAAAISA